MDEDSYYIQETRAQVKLNLYNHCAFNSTPLYSLPFSNTILLLEKIVGTTDIFRYLSTSCLCLLYPYSFILPPWVIWSISNQVYPALTTADDKNLWTFSWCTFSSVGVFVTMFRSVTTNRQCYRCWIAKISSIFSTSTSPLVPINCSTRHSITTVTESPLRSPTLLPPSSMHHPCHISHRLHRSHRNRVKEMHAYARLPARTFDFIETHL